MTGRREQGREAFSYNSVLFTCTTRFVTEQTNKHPLSMIAEQGPKCKVSKQRLNKLNTLPYGLGLSTSCS